MNKQQSGFTLIELIIVIVILGILAVTAAPRFIDIQEDARAATVEAVRASINTVNSVVHAKALVQGVADADEQDMVINYDGGSLAAADIDFLYLGADAETDFAALLEINTADFTIETVADASTLAGYGGTMTANPIVYVFPKGTISPNPAATGDSCYAYYIEATDTTRPLIGTVTTGC